MGKISTAKRIKRADIVTLVPTKAVASFLLDTWERTAVAICTLANPQGEYSRVRSSDSKPNFVEVELDNGRHILLMHSKGFTNTDSIIKAIVKHPQVDFVCTARTKGQTSPYISIIKMQRGEKGLPLKENIIKNIPPSVEKKLVDAGILELFRSHTGQQER